MVRTARVNSTSGMLCKSYLTITVYDSFPSRALLLVTRLEHGLLIVGVVPKLPSQWLGLSLLTVARQPIVLGMQEISTIVATVPCILSILLKIIAGTPAVRIRHASQRSVVHYVVGVI